MRYLILLYKMFYIFLLSFFKKIEYSFPFFLGGGVHIYIDRQSFIKICKRVTIRSGNIQSLSGGSIELDDNVFINSNCNIIARNKIKIGKNTLIGPNVCIYDHNHIFSYNYISPDKFLSNPILIGSNVWIAANVTILSGVNIGNGAVIGAGVVVTHDVAPHTIVKLGDNIVTKKIEK